MSSALIYMTIFTREIEPPAYLYELDIPVVLLNCYSADHAFPAVVPSEIAGGQSATEHLIRNGHTRIGTIMGEAHHVGGAGPARRAIAGRWRQPTFRSIPTLVADGNWSASAGYDATVKLLALEATADGDLLPERPHGDRLLRSAEGSRATHSRGYLGGRL